MIYHPYGCPFVVKLPDNTTTQDLRALAAFNAIMRNYLLMNRLQKTKN